MKITKQKLNQIIKEEIRYVLNEENSPMEVLGIHNISNSKVLINAVQRLLDQGGINDDITARTIEKWLSGSIQKEPDEVLRAKMTKLRNETLRAVGLVGREGQTGYERRRASKQRAAVHRQGLTSEGGGDDEPECGDGDCEGWEEDK